MNDKLRWALDWAWVGACTGALAPLPAALSMGFIPDSFLRTAGVLGAASGLLLGLALGSLYGALPERNRAAMMGVLAPLPLGTWGACVAGGAAWLVVPNMAGIAFFLGSLAAVAQMSWFVPLYVVLLGRGLRLLALALAVVLAPACGWLAVAAFFGVTGS